MNAPIVNPLTVDVEDYFHVSALAQSIDRADWDSIEPRVINNTQRVLDVFAEAEVHGTFFVLGWVAERYPKIVTSIVDAGHEIACHGFSHKLIYTQTIAEFTEETQRAKALLEDISGMAVRGYRAASYSITNRSLWALNVIAEAGFEYDSSIVPARHDLYGLPGSRAHPYKIEIDASRKLVEFPPSTIAIAGQNIPIGGGGYFRIFPYAFSRWGMKRVNERSKQPFSFYLHPWEIDPDQPRVRTSLKSRFRHYHNLHLFEPRLRKLLEEFRFGTMGNVIDSLSLPSVALNDLGKSSAAPDPEGQ